MPLPLEGEGGGGGGGKGERFKLLHCRGLARRGVWGRAPEANTFHQIREAFNWPLRTTRTNAYSYDSLFIKPYCRFNGETFTSLFTGRVSCFQRPEIAFSIHSCIVSVIV